MTASELCAQGAEEESSSSGSPEGRGASPLAIEGELLVATASLLDGMFDAAPVGLGLLDPQLRVIRINRALARIASVAELAPGGPIGEVLPALATAEFLAEARQVLATGEESQDVEVSLPDEAPGVWRAFREGCFAIRGPRGVLGVGMVVQEVTRRRRQDELQERILGIVGHDLRSPLAAVRVSAQLLGRNLADPRQVRLLRVIEGAARRMQRIVEGLLDYTLARAGGGIPIRPRRIDVSEVCREVVAEALAAEPARAARCEGEGDTCAELDPDRLGQALANVVGNALRYGLPEEAVEVRWRGEPDEVVVEVTNRGPPIPPELVRHVFEPFRRGAHAAGGSGLGLGLFIARHIVGAHGGSLTVQSACGETCFTMTLPRRQP